MNPEIEKFWKDQGYSIECHVLTSDEWKVVWILIKGFFEVGWIGVSEWYPRPYPSDESNLPPCKFYYLDRETYSEEEMLRLIKLKAFW